MVQDFQPHFRQALLVGRIERRGPGGVLAHDDGRLHLHLAIDQQILRRIAGRAGDEAGGQIAVEEILQMVVIGMHPARQLVARCARRDGWQLQPARPGLQRQRHFAGVGGDHGVDMVLVGGALIGAHGVRRRVVVVIGHDLDLAATDAAAGVDLLGGQLRRIGDGHAANRRVFCNYADLDRVRRPGERWKCGNGNSKRQRFDSNHEQSP